MERKIGEIFEFGGEWCQCVESKQDACTDCAFNPINGIGYNCSGSCTYKQVIFKKLEKVGEPMEFARGLYFQRYRLAYSTAFYEGDTRLFFNAPTKTFVYIEIKQNKEDMEEKKDNYDGYMDKECIPICDALNSIPNVQTTESCCGHCRDRFMIFLTCDNPHSLAIIARVFDRRYIGTSQPWHIELQTKDSGAYDYLIHSETKYDSEEVMMKDVNQIIENIEHWCDDKFASHFKGCDDKPTLAPFDINLAKAGKPVCTRNGKKARIICFDFRDADEICCIIVAVDYGEAEKIHYYDLYGKYRGGDSSEYDLMMLPEKKEGWVNLYKSSVRSTKEEAMKYRNKCNDYIDTIKIEWEE